MLACGVSLARAIVVSQAENLDRLAAIAAMVDRHQGLVAIGRAIKADAMGMKILAACRPA